MNQSDSTAEDSLRLSKIFHEIKNPLTLINSSLQIIERDHPEVRTFRFWNQTMNEIAGLRQLIEDLSVFQKGTVVNRSRIHSFDFVEELLESIEAFLMQTGVPLTLENTAEDLDFYADDVRLRHAIINLLKNAAESSESGSPVFLGIHADEKNLYISVADQGCGISEEQMPHLFEPFHTTKARGTGLGLPIVKQVVESHQGAITVHSKEGAGTAFHIVLPLS